MRAASVAVALTYVRMMSSKSPILQFQIMPKKSKTAVPAAPVLSGSPIGFSTASPDVVRELPDGVSADTPCETLLNEDANLDEVFEPKVEVPWVPSRVTPENFLSTGITTLNLSLTNSSDCGIEKGTMTWLIGASSSGKTLIALQLLAEAANNPHFADYSLIYADVEGGARFDLRPMFGNKLADRIEWATMTNGEMFHTVEDFYGYADTRQRDDKPFILVLDSMDSLGTTPEAKRFLANIAEREENIAKGKEYESISPGMGDGKAKLNSTGLRRLRNKLPNNGSMFICVSQERTDITTGYKTVSGGKALKFYSDTALWLSAGKAITKEWKGLPRHYGNYASFDIIKNRTSGMRAKIEFPILIGTGISDVDSCVEWLGAETIFTVPKVPATQAWTGTLPDGSQFKLTKQKLIEYFEEHPDVMKTMMQTRWHQILDNVVPVRKKRYE